MELKSNYLLNLLILIAIAIIILLPNSVLSQVNNTNNLESKITNRSINLGLVDVIELLLKNNRNLKNARLDRVIQRQELREAESAFDWQLQPSLGVGLGYRNSEFEDSLTLFDSISGSSFLENSNSDDIFLSTEDDLGSDFNLIRSTQLSSRRRTSLGTSIIVGVDPFADNNLTLRVVQPLLRGAGKTINEAPIKQARFTENSNILELENTITEQITDTTISYNALIQAQQTFKIQQSSLQTLSQQLEFLQVLVNAGRRAKAELIDIQSEIASTQANLVSTQNQLEQAKSELLGLLDLDFNLDVTATDNFNNNKQQQITKLTTLNINELLDIAYANRPEYSQAKLNIQTAQIDRLIAADNQRWGLDLQTNLDAGENVDISTGLVFTRVFRDRSLETASVRSQVQLQQNQNNLERVSSAIAREVQIRLKQVQLTRDRITLARQARELAQRRLDIANEKFKRGRETDIFEVLELQSDLTFAREEETTAQVEFLDATTRFEQAVGITLERWQQQVNLFFDR
jgi:outer membrane protein